MCITAKRDFDSRWAWEGGERYENVIILEQAVVPNGTALWAKNYSDKLFLNRAKGPGQLQFSEVGRLTDRSKLSPVSNGLRKPSRASRRRR